MSTNFLSLPSGGFIASQSKPCYTLSKLPTLLYYIPVFGFDQCFLLLTKPPVYANNISTKTHSGVRTVISAEFFMPFSRPCGPLEGTWLLNNSRNCPVVVRPGRSMGRGNSFGFFCRNTKPIGGINMIPQETLNGPRPGSRPGRRKRLASVTRNIRYSLTETAKGGA
jgi:hypothetical protein